MEDSHFNVAFGYLAVLLGYFTLLQHLSKVIRDALPGGTLQSLIASIKEFIYHHEKVDALSENYEHSQTGMTEQLSRMLRKLCDTETKLALDH